ncbi:acyl-CoA thioesterase [Alcanivorax limicola]|uniref:acyl-CoA thioesterase n=1 Tax=Alcanivorax limicola TaxID=2874102 RepID=UPI001CBCC777|nr:thioesterase family protein [Alcanivorax limicola]
MLTLTINPRFSDTDALGHINNTVVPVWFLEAREPVLRLFQPDLDFRRGGLALVRTEIDYLAETRFGEPVDVTTEVQRIGNSSFVLAHTLHQAGRITARGIATMVNFDPATRRAVPVPESIRAQLAAHMTEDMTAHRSGDGNGSPDGSK